MVRARNENEIMEAKPEKILWISLLIAIPVAVFGAAVTLLNLLHTPYAVWLQVEAPPYAVVGGTLDIGITLGQVPEPSFLVVDLYQFEKDHRAISDHPSLSRSLSVHNGVNYSLRMEVKEVEKLAFLQLVIYLSPTGDWRTRTHAARSQVIPVKIQADQAGGPAMRRIRAFIISRSRSRDIPFQPGGSLAKRASVYPTAAFRIFLIGLLVVGCLVCLIRSTRLRLLANHRATRKELFWRGAPILLFLAFLWEILRLEERVSEWGRRVVSGLDLYYSRQSYQKAALALLAAAFAVLLVISFRAVSRNRARLYPVLAGIALAGYTSVSLAAALSFHSIDLLELTSVAGASVVDLAKAACAAAFLIMVLVAPRPSER